MNFPAFTNTSKVNANEFEAVDLREQFMVSSHKWVVGVLEDLIGYSEANGLDDVGEALCVVTELVIQHLQTPEVQPQIGDTSSNVIAFPKRPGGAFASKLNSQDSAIRPYSLPSFFRTPDDRRAESD
jgi:hypothetical protein